MDSVAIKGMFQTYLIASGAIDYPAVRKRALLLHCLGTEGQTIFNTLPQDDAGDNNEYDAVIQVLNTHFSTQA